jgi:hypothetical protein
VDLSRQRGKITSINLDLDTIGTPVYSSYPSEARITLAAMLDHEPGATVLRRSERAGPW